MNRSPPMNPPPSSQIPARVRWRWRWGRIVLLGLVAGIGALGWNQYTWNRAVRQLAEAGITADAHEHLGERLWRTAKADWRELFKAGTWRTEPVWWRIAYDKARELRSLDALAPALRRINPEVLHLSNCPVLKDVDGLKGLTALQRLHLAVCPELENVDGLRGLTALQRLYLSYCPALQNVNGLKGLPALEYVDLIHCPKLPPEQVAALRAALPGAVILYP